MNPTKIQQHISTDRFQKYLNRCSNDYIKAIALYEVNTKLSQELYTILNHYEVALRNGINYHFTNKYHSPEWYNQWLLDSNFASYQHKILSTKQMIDRRRETPSSGKVIAEFTLGFWSQMFNANQERLLWSELRKVFRNIPRTQRRRTTIGPYIQKIRKFRNRVYHYEPICWNFRGLERNYENIIQVIEWIDSDLHQWVTNQCTFKSQLASLEVDLSNKGVPTT